MSMTKSLTGLLAEILVAAADLDETALVSSSIPELADSAFGNATVRQVTDMTTGLAYSEDYADPQADIQERSDRSDVAARLSGRCGIPAVPEVSSGAGRLNGLPDAGFGRRGEQDVAPYRIEGLDLPDSASLSCACVGTVLAIRRRNGGTPGRNARRSESRHRYSPDEAGSDRRALRAAGLSHGLCGIDR